MWMNVRVYIDNKKLGRATTYLKDLNLLLSTESSQRLSMAIYTRHSKE